MASGNISGNGSTDWIPISDGHAGMTLKGNFDSGTITVEIRDQFGGAVALPNGDFTADTAKILEFGGGVYVRFTMAGGGDGIDVNWSLFVGVLSSSRLT